MELLVEPLVGPGDQQLGGWKHSGLDMPEHLPQMELRASSAYLARGSAHEGHRLPCQGCPTGKARAPVQGVGQHGRDSIVVFRRGDEHSVGATDGRLE